MQMNLCNFMLKYSNIVRFRETDSLNRRLIEFEENLANLLSLQSDPQEVTF